MKHMKEDEFTLQELREELELKAVPEKVEEKLKVLYAELPDELPVRGGNVRSLLKVLGTVTGTAAAAFLLLFGLNTVNPALAESLPGLGNLFRNLNGTKVTGGNIPTYDDAVRPLDVAAEPKAGEQEKLNFTEYYSDGTYLYLSLKLEAPGEEKEIAWYSPEWYTDEKTRMGIDLSQVTVNGKQAETYKKLFLEKNGEGAYEGTWAVRLPERAENGESLTVQASVPELYGTKTARYLDNPPDAVLKPEFKASFTVTADTSHNRISEAETEDNGVKVQKVECTPANIRIGLDIPFWGRESDTLLNTNAIALGYPVLTLEDGTRLSHSFESPDFDWDYDNLKNGGRIQGTWVYEGAPEDSGTAILRIYEKQSDLLFSVGDAELDHRFVFAEFTIDLNTGHAEPSKRYLELGMEKLDTGSYDRTARHAPFTNGYFVHCCEVEEGVEPIDEYTAKGNGVFTQNVILYTENPEYRALELRCYRDGELITSLRSCPEEEYNQTDEYLDGSISYYKGEEGEFYCSPIRDPELTAGIDMTVLSFHVNYAPDTRKDGEWGSILPEDRFNKLTLADPETGEILIEDVWETLQQENLETYGERFS